MRNSSIVSSAILGLCIGVGIAFAGMSLGHAILKSRTTQRYVCVRGLAEQEVDADLAIWPITFQESSNGLVDLYKRIDEKREIISSFLIAAGFKSSDISFSSPGISDKETQATGESNKEPKYRYTARVTVTLRSNDVSSVKKAMQQSGSLVGKGVVLTGDNWESHAQFLFTGLNRIKPAMIEEATKNAREAATKFAKDSGSKVGKIRSASQGFFDITDRDPNSQDKKMVRVVTTVEYFLVDE